MDEEQPIWMGQVAHLYTLKVMPIGDNMNRGNLEIYQTSTGDLKFQKEVTVNRMLEGGGDAAMLREWQRVVVDWVKNKS